MSPTSLSFISPGLRRPPLRRGWRYWSLAGALTIACGGGDGASQGQSSSQGDQASSSTSSSDASQESGDTNDDIGVTPSLDLDEGSVVSPDDGEGGDAGDESVSNDCGEIDFEGQSSTPRVVLLLDKSGSMSKYEWEDGGETVTRWKSLHRTVEFLVSEFSENVHFGAKLFPFLESDPDDVCTVEPGVDVEVGPDSADLILSTLPGPDAEVVGGTPTATALRETVAYLQGLDTEEARAIILVMDGLTEDCGDTDAQLQAAARMSKSVGIPVYVVGIDLNSAAALRSLELLAKSGGTDRYYLSDDAEQLREAMTEIVGEIASCVIPLDPTPINPDLVEVELADGSLIPALLTFHDCEDALAAGHTAGWVYTSDDVPREVMELCGAGCDDFRDQGRVEISYRCPPPE